MIFEGARTVYVFQRRTRAQLRGGLRLGILSPPCPRATGRAEVYAGIYAKSSDMATISGAGDQGRVSEYLF
eukprot:250564-Prorocentrum_minimum.AAC.1